MNPSIPSEARQRAVEILLTLEEQLKPLFDSLEEGSNSAIQFRLPEQP